MIYYYKAFKPKKSVPIMLSIIITMIVAIPNPTSAPAITIRTKMNSSFPVDIKVKGV